MEVNRDQRHAELLVPAVQYVCRSAQIELSDLEAIAVDVGPGLFTGLRVGVATAKALSLALSRPLIAVCSLDIVAFALRASRRLVVVALDARRGEVFYACYRPDGEGIGRVGEAAVGLPGDLAEMFAALEEDVLLVGDGALRYRQNFAGLANVELGGRDYAHPRAAAMVELVALAGEEYEKVSPDDVTPAYLRKPDAEANWIERGGVKGGERG